MLVSRRSTVVSHSGGARAPAMCERMTITNGRARRRFRPVASGNGRADAETRGAALRPLTQDTLDLLHAIGLEFESYGQRLFSHCRNFPLSILYARDDDIPGYVGFGASISASSAATSSTKKTPASKN